MGYADALDAGMCVPLHGFFCEVLNHFVRAPSQLMPNTELHLACVYTGLPEAGMRICWRS